MTLSSACLSGLGKRAKKLQKRGEPLSHWSWHQAWGSRQSSGCILVSLTLCGTDYYLIFFAQSVHRRGVKARDRTQLNNVEWCINHIKKKKPFHFLVLNNKQTIKCSHSKCVLQILVCSDWPVTGLHLVPLYKHTHAVRYSFRTTSAVIWCVCPLHTVMTFSAL